MKSPRQGKRCGLMSFREIRPRVAEALDYGIGPPDSISEGVRCLGEWKERDRASIPTNILPAESRDTCENRKRL